jgi:hypothetical protein
MSEKRLIDVRLVRGRDGVWRAMSADTAVHTTNIISCVGCPFNGGRCRHPNAPPPPGNSLAAAFDKAYANGGAGKPVPPAWCPLRRGPAVVMLAEDT